MFKQETKDIQCKNVAEFVNALRVLHLHSKNIFYRGQSNVQYNLKPSVLRDDRRTSCEDKMYLKVLSECYNEFTPDMTLITLLSKIQHYGVPTRILDLTTNALVALYSACKENILKELGDLGITKVTLHPELYKMAEYINEC